jgi:hypothetical protein
VYPQAGFVNFASKREDKCVPLALLASVYNSSRSPILQEQNKVSEKQEKENEKIAVLEQRATKAEADLKKALDDASTNATIVNKLSAELKAIKDEKHADLVEQAYRARVEAGIASEEKTDRAMLAGLDVSWFPKGITRCPYCGNQIKPSSCPNCQRSFATLPYDIKYCLYCSKKVAKTADDTIAILQPAIRLCRYSNADDKLLLDLHRKGQSNADIGRTIGRYQEPSQKTRRLKLHFSIVQPYSYA